MNYPADNNNQHRTRIEQLAADVVATCLANGIKVATAESCTGGMISSSLTDIAGSSDVFDRGFVTYSNEAKAEMLGVPFEHTQNPGAVSALVAEEMAAGALRNSTADLAVAVTGIAGPGGGSLEKPVGLVFVALKLRGGPGKVEEHRFWESRDDLTRHEIRQLTVIEALEHLLSFANSD